MQRHCPRRSSCVLAVSALFASASLVAPAHAQLVNRGRANEQPGIDLSDEDDILAPSTPSAASTPKSTPAAAARALQVGLVSLVPLGDAGKTTADQVTTELMKELNDGQVFGVAPLTVELKGATASDGDAAARLAASGLASLVKAQALLDKLQIGKARRAFEAALDQLQRGAAALSDTSALTAARLGLAEAAARQGQDEAADVQLALAASLNPELQLDNKRVAPQFVRSFARARDGLLKAKRGTVVVDESATGATVEIDGRPLGTAPVTVTELPAGRHLVRALREGRPPWGEVIDVRAGEVVTVRPGFLAASGTSWLDDLQRNQLNPVAADSVAAAARARGQRAALVGVLSKNFTAITVQLVLVDAATGGFTRLPSISFQADLLDISIESLKAREAVASLLGADQPDPQASFARAPLSDLLAGAKTLTSAEMRTVAVRYEVKALRERPSSRLVTADKSAIEQADGDEDESRTVLSAGKSGKRKRLDDEDDPYVNRDGGKDAPLDPDAPITSQPWFLPAVIGGGAAAVVLLGGITTVTLVGLKVLPDPRPANGGTVSVTLP